MIQAASKCLDPELLRDVLRGRLPHERFATAIEHLDQCSECSEAIQRLNERERNEPDSIVRQLREPPPSDQWVAEPDCQSAMLHLLSQSPFPQTTASDALPLARIGPYRLIGHLGRGGMGTVYLAEHDRLKRTAAIKLLPRQRITQPGWLERFDREMTAVASLEHPHVVRALDAGEEAGWHYLVMEHLEGLDLSRVARRLQDVSVGAVCELMRQAALGLAAVHEIGMVHRDVKPSNLFLTRSGTVKLLDLGLVLADDELLASDDRLTTVGHLMGTVPYMAPEQLADSRKVDFRADLYGLGATMHRLLTGKTPHASAGNLASTIRAVSEGQCPSIATQRHDLPPELVTLVDELLGYDPQQRPGSATEIARRLEVFADADAPREVIRRAMACDEQADEQPSAVATFEEMDGRAVGSPPRNRMRWLGLALVPLAFLAGIVITLSTDRGTLVIESDVPGVEVSVFQGEEKVTDLRVETDESTVKLFSGPYEVRLKNTQADGFHIENERVVLTRGDEQVVRIRRTPEVIATTTPEDPSRPSFQGKPLDHWLGILRNEQDPATLGTALQAAGLLARGEERLEAAKTALLPARQLGGMVSPSGDRPSHRFMLELGKWFPAFFPEPGVEAIAAELREGSRESAMACASLLAGFRSGDFGDARPPAGVEDGIDFYRQQATTPSGHELLKRLKSGVEFRVGELHAGIEERTLGSSAIFYRSSALLILVDQALVLNKLLDTEIDPVVADILRLHLEEQKQAVAENRDDRPKAMNPGDGGLFAQYPHSWANIVWGLSRSNEPDQIPAAVFLPALIIRSELLDSEESVQLYEELAESRREETAEAMIRWLRDAAPVSGSSSTSIARKVAVLKAIDADVFQAAIEDLANSHPSAIGVISHFLSGILSSPQPHEASSFRNIRQWAASDHGKQVMEGISNAATIAFDQLEKSDSNRGLATLQGAWEARVKVLLLLGKDPAQDHELVRHLRERVGRRLEASTGEDETVVDVPRDTLLTVSEIWLLAELDGWEALPPAVLLDPLFAEETSPRAGQAFKAMQQIAEAQPERLAKLTAEALIQHWKKLSEANTGAVETSKGDTFFLPDRHEVWQMVLRHLGENAHRIEEIEIADLEAAMSSLQKHEPSARKGGSRLHAGFVEFFMKLKQESQQ